MEGCGVCYALPQTDDEVALAFMLSDSFMEPEQLAETAAMLRAGERVAVPAEMRDHLLVALRSARSQLPPPPPPPPPPLPSSQQPHWPSQPQPQASARPQRGVVADVLLKMGILAAGVLVLVLMFHPFPKYQWAMWRNSPEALETFLKAHPSDEYSFPVKERLRVLNDSQVWAEVVAADSPSMVRQYLRAYSKDGQHLEEARDWVQERAALVWATLAVSRSEAELRQFMRDYRESAHAATAENRIAALHRDFEWIREQDKLEYYRKFLAAFPGHAQTEWMEQRMVDLEVAAIAAGKHGALPQAEAVSRSGGIAEVVVKNDTGHELTLYYSGPSSKKLVVPKGETGTTTLKPGKYQVAASVAADRVNNFYGNGVMGGGRYSSRFFIRTDGYGPGGFTTLPTGGFMPAAR